jgi:hypothetical protein
MYEVTAKNREKLPEPQDERADGANNTKNQWPPARSEDEWLLMYLRGVPIPKIARWCRVNHETVRHSIRQREKLTPSIIGRRLVLHDRPRHQAARHGKELSWDRHYARCSGSSPARAASRSSSAGPRRGACSQAGPRHAVGT